MRKPKATSTSPGPWRATESATVVDVAGETVAVVRQVDSRSGDEEAANGALLAAAPDLLAVLEAIMREVKPVLEHHCHPATLRLARAAIAKARTGRGGRK